jgi:hypothetical protein
VQISILAGKSIDASGNEWTPNLKFERPTPVSLFHFSAPHFSAKNLAFEEIMAENGINHSRSISIVTEWRFVDLTPEGRRSLFNNDCNTASLVQTTKSSHQQ